MWFIYYKFIYSPSDHLLRVLIPKFSPGIVEIWCKTGHIEIKVNINYNLLCGGAGGVMVIVVGNGHGDTSSKPGRDWLHFT